MPAIRTLVRGLGQPSSTVFVLRASVAGLAANQASRMLDLNALDVDEIATALSDQTDYEHRWLIDPRTGEIAFWTSDTGIDGENPIDLDELDLLPIEPIPSGVWYADMARLRPAGRPWCRTATLGPSAVRPRSVHTTR